MNNLPNQKKFTFALDPRQTFTQSYKRTLVHDFGLLGLGSTEPLPSRLPWERGTFPVGVPGLCVESFWVCHDTHLTK